MLRARSVEIILKRQVPGLQRLFWTKLTKLLTGRTRNYAVAFYFFFVAVRLRDAVMPRFRMPFGVCVCGGG